MLGAAARKNRGFSVSPFSRKGARCGTLHPRNRTHHEIVVRLLARKGSAVLCCRRGRQTRPWRHRIYLFGVGLRPQNDPPRPDRSRKTATTTSRLVPKKRGGRKPLIENTPQLEPAFKKVLEVHTAGDPM